MKCGTTFLQVKCIHHFFKKNFTSEFLRTEENKTYMEKKLNYLFGAYKRLWKSTIFKL